MGYKCKNCGYTFREGDGDICPECLTPMEQSADCSQYHSHDAFEDKGFSNPAYGNPSYSQHDYQQSTFSTGTVQKQKNKNGFLRAIITIIVLVVIGNVALPLITRLVRSNAFDDVVDSIVEEVVTTVADENLPEVSTAVPQDNTLAVGETLEINATVKDYDEEYTYLSLTNLGQFPEGIDFGENHQIYALDIEIYAPSKEYSSSDITHLYFYPRIVANYLDHEGKVKKDVTTLNPMTITAGILPNQIDDSIIVKNDTTITGTLYFDVDTKHYTNKSLVVDFNYYDDEGKHHDGKVTLAQIDKEIKK